VSPKRWRIVHECSNVLSIQDDRGQEICQIYSDCDVTSKMRRLARRIAKLPELEAQLLAARRPEETR